MSILICNCYNNIFMGNGCAGAKKSNVDKKSSPKYIVSTQNSSKKWF